MYGDVVLGSCDHCFVSNLLVRFVEDPFRTQVYPDEPKRFSQWCWPCYQDRLEDL